MTNAPREQRFVFGEVAEEYENYRPSYPDALFDAVIDFAGVRAGDRVLEIGAGTGKATTGFLARGFQVHALEPVPEMAAILRTKGAEVEATVFESWDPPAAGFPLAYAAQAWHWVGGDDRYERLAASLHDGGAVALFWNKARPWTGTLGAENAAEYERHVPGMSSTSQWELDWVSDEIAACLALEAPETLTVTWSRTYTRDEWVQLLGTHSDQRILPEELRTRLHAAIGDVIDRHGGTVDVVYDVAIYLSRKVSRTA